MKKFLFLFVCVLSIIYIVFSLSACDYTMQKEDHLSEKNDIKYEVQYGINADTLSIEDKSFYTKYIDDYISYCKSAYTNSLLPRGDFSINPYLFIDNIFMYDFRNIDISSLDQGELILYNELANQYGKKPKLYIFCNGVCNYFPNNYFTNLDGTGIVFSMFVSEDDYFLPMMYNYIASRTYVYSIPQSVKIINFGNEFSVTYKPTVTELGSYVPNYLVLKDR